MGGFDLIDQRISYYHPNLSCCCKWFPLFVQLLSMVQNNAYVVYSDHYKGDSITHKQFTYNIVEDLMRLSHKYFNYQHADSPATVTGGDCVSTRSLGNSTIATNENLHFKTPPQPKQKLLNSETVSASIHKRIQMAKGKDKMTSLANFPQRTIKPKHMHFRRKRDTDVTKMESCVMCSILYAAKKKGEVVGAATRM